MWKIQRHKCYGMTIANSYGTTKDINSYGKKKTLTFVKYQEAPFSLPLPTLPSKPKASSHQAWSSIF